MSVGRPHAGVDLALRDPDDPERPVAARRRRRSVPPLARRDVGLLARARISTAAAFTPDGFVRTGDLGWIDDEGRLRLVGRSKEMYVRGGYNVHPMEVEAVLGQHPAVADIAIAPRPDDVMGEVGVAFVVVRCRRGGADRRRPPRLRRRPARRVQAARSRSSSSTGSPSRRWRSSTAAPSRPEPRRHEPRLTVLWTETGRIDATAVNERGGPAADSMRAATARRRASAPGGPSNCTLAGIGPPTARGRRSRARRRCSRGWRGRSAPGRSRRAAARTRACAGSAITS